MQFLEGHNHTIYQLGFSPDGSVLVSTGRGTKMMLWEFPEGKLGSRVRGTPFEHESIEFSPDGRSCALLSSSTNLFAQIYQTEQPFGCVSIPSPREQAPMRLVTCCSRFSVDGSQLVLLAMRYSSSFASAVSEEVIQYRWDVEAKELRECSRSEFPRRAGLGYVWRFDSSSTWAGMTGLGRVAFWNLSDREIGFELDLPSETWALGLAFSADGRRFGCYTTNAIHIIDVPNRKHLLSFKNPTRNHIQSLAFSPDGQTLATVSNDTCVRFWETDTGREVKTYAWEMGQLKAVTIAPDGMRAAAAGKKGKIVVWDLD